MESMIEFVHQRIKKHKYQNGIDFTMGNGHDTLFLSDYCHHVYSYDIQSLALNNTKELVKRKKNITLFLKSHEYFDEDVRDFEVGIFNLGYLPGGLKNNKKSFGTFSQRWMFVCGCLYWT